MTALADNGIVHLTASRSVDEVLEHLLSILRATKLVIFGNPKAGTPVMIAAPDSALDLPLKILIAEDPSGSTRVSYNSVGYLQARFGLTPEVVTNVAAIEQIAAALVR